jgi:hypothetical protein
MIQTVFELRNKQGNHNNHANQGNLKILRTVTRRRNAVFVYSARYWCPILTTTETCSQVLLEIPSMKFEDNPFGLLHTYGQTDFSILDYTI